METKSPSDFVKPDLKNLRPEIKQYIINLEKENLKLHSKIAKLQVANLSISNKNKTMEKEIVKLNKQTNGLTIYLPYNGRGPSLPTHVQTADGKYIEIDYKHDK